MDKRMDEKSNEKSDEKSDGDAMQANVAAHRGGLRRRIQEEIQRVDYGGKWWVKSIKKKPDAYYGIELITSAKAENMRPPYKAHSVHQSHPRIYGEKLGCR